MTKSELFAYVATKLKLLGYRSRRNYYYQIIDDDYLIGLFLDPSSYCKGYRFICGAIYLPDEQKMPFCGKFDIQRNFIFPLDSNSLVGSLDYIDSDSRELSTRNTIFEYENYTIEQLDKLFETNYSRFVVPLMNKEYGLEKFRDNWKSMNRFSKNNVMKICKRAGINSDEVLAYLGKQ